MKKSVVYILIGLSFLLTSCIRNDLSYPTVVPTFDVFEVEDAKSVTINQETRTIDIVLQEYANVRNVRILNYSMTNSPQIVGGLPHLVDLSEPIKIVLRTYQDYEWTITATCPIDRHIICDNQVGDADIDEENKIAYVYVSENQSLMNVTFNDVKLEPEGSVVESTTGYIVENGVSVSKTEKCVFPMTLDCVVMRYFTIKYKGKEIVWSVKVLQKAVPVKLESVNAWTYSADVKGVTNGQGKAEIQWRSHAEENWTALEEVQMNGNSVSATITGLNESTEYVVRITNGVETSEEYSFRTGTARQLENLSFDSWTKDNKYPNAQGYDIWDTANSSGAAVTTSPTEDAVSGNAAKLETVTAFGILAAGNIFTGQFAGLAGLGAELDWGTPFAERPAALKGYFKYSPQIINKAKEPYKDKTGQTDECQILVALTDWDEPFRVNTNKKQFVDFDTDSGVIAYGVFNTSETVNEYREVVIPLEYRSTDRTPKYIVIAAAASRYGDYFTGGVGSVLYIDEFELEYK